MKQLLGLQHTSRQGTEMGTGIVAGNVNRRKRHCPLKECTIVGLLCYAGRKVGGALRLRCSSDSSTVHSAGSTSCHCPLAHPPH